MKKVLFSGIQPTGVPHIGNFFGALRQWRDLQRTMPEAKRIYSIVDLHALTSPSKQRDKNASFDMACALLAIGIDPKQSSLFIQSTVPAHVQCAWHFMCHTPLGWLNRMTQWKVPILCFVALYYLLSM